MWPDNETAVDLLGFEVHAELLAGLVTNSGVLPVTAGLFGDWGGGKSSVMRMLKERLEAQDGVACLYFNGWTFEGYDDAKTALITSILIELGEHKRFLPELRGRVARLLKRINYMRMASMILKHGSHAASAAGGLALVTGFIDPHTAAALMGTSAAVTRAIRGAEEAVGVSTEGQPSEVGKVAWAEMIEKDESRPEPLDIRTFRRDFDQLLADSKLNALVVLIDDLDRCSPERLIENLEAIKLFLAVPRSAFVIAADERIVRHAVATRYAAQHSDSAQLVTDYVEKLVQVPYHLPRLSASEIETYISLLFCQLYVADGAAFDRVRRDCAEQRRKNPRHTYGVGAVAAILGTGVSDELGRSLQWGSTIAPILAEGLKGNPRQVKRMLNALLLRRQLADIASLDISDEVLVRLMLLEYSRPALFEQLYMWQAISDGRPQQLMTLEKAAREVDKMPDEFGAWDEHWVRRWLSLEPPLAPVDLGDCFWVARDRIRADIAAVSAVSPAVRRIFESLVASDEITWRLTMTEAEALDQDDQSVLVGLLSSHVTRHPDQDSPIRSLARLSEIKAPGAAATLIQTMQGVTVASLHPSAARRLENAIESDASLRVGLVPILEHWASGGSAAGRAAKQTLSRLNRPGVER